MSASELSDEEHSQLFDLLVEQAREDFIAYLELFHPQGHDPIILGSLHYALATRFQDVVDGTSSAFQSVSVPPQHGKLVSLIADVMTTNGWKKHGKLEVGDFVFHPSGKPVEVVNYIPQEQPASMEVTLSNGEKLKVHPNHEWTVKRGRRLWMTLETREILRQGLWEGTPGKRGSRARFQLPNFGGTVLPDAELPLDPYFMGVWLGDGYTTHPSVCGVDMEIFNSICYTETASNWNEDTDVRYAYYGGQGIMGVLKDLQLTEGKYLPSQYLMSSRKQRLELLAGLIDSDGNLTRSTGQYRFINANKYLIRGVCDLLTTLGYSFSVTSADPCESSSGIVGTETVYYVGFTPLDIIPCRVPRKQSKKIVHRRAVSIINIRKLPESEQEPGNCITVDSPDGLYCVGRKMIPTHNSTILSVEGVSWLMGHSPGIAVALTGFSYTLCTSFAKKVRDRIEDPRYQQIFPGVLPKDGFNKQDEYELTNGSTLVAKSAGSKLTGRRVDFLIVDDAHAGRAEAESTSQREKVIEWFNADCMTRLSPDGKVFLIGTRWHLLDLIGYVTSEDFVNRMTADDNAHMIFDVINYKAICDSDDGSDPLGRVSGEALFPEVRHIKFLMGLKSALPNYEWESQYQGNPMTGASGQADIANLVLIKYEDLPKDLRLSRGWDLAISESQRADYTAGALVGYRKKQKELYIIHVMRAKMGWSKLRAKMIDRSLNDIKDFKCSRCKIEAVSGFEAVYRDIKLALRGKVKVTKNDSLQGDKLVRAQPWLNMIEVGRVFVVIAPWNKDFFTELEQFPEGANDDQVDAVTTAYDDVKKGGVALA